MSFKRIRNNGQEVEIVSICGGNTDYYQWGKNVANLDLGVEAAYRIANAPQIPIEGHDLYLFWSGYYSV